MYFEAYNLPFISAPYTAFCLLISEGFTNNIFGLVQRSAGCLLSSPTWGNKIGMSGLLPLLIDQPNEAYV